MNYIKKNSSMMWGILVVVVALLGFWSGTKFGTSNGTGNQNGFQRTGGQGGGRRGFMQSGNFITGQILNKDDKSITIKMQDGSSRFIFFSNTTKIMKSTDGTSDDLTVGKEISANGTPNSDGSITAQSIQLRTLMPRPAAQ